ncbi:MAG TPA: hypothetical protein VMM18_06970 [Gemmatimonadaceae bacterium]|nr:hypothetical protein [Gemmatimonadaceae bacterium]
MPAPEDPVRTDLPRRGPWTFAYAPGTHRFELQTEAVVEALTASVVDTITSVIVLAYDIRSMSDGFRVDGRVESFGVSGVTGEMNAGVDQLPIEFSMAIDSLGRLSEFSSPDTSTCGSPSAALLASARELLVLPPHTLDLTTTWTDSTSSIVCRGDIPIVTEARREHRVSGTVALRDRRAVRMLRRSTVTISGASTRPTQVVRVTGSGTADAEFFLDPVSGRFLGGTSRSTADISFDAASRREHFRQHVRQTITPL